MALSDCPKDVEYFFKYLNHLYSIAMYKILGIQGSLGMVTSSNAEAGHLAINMLVLLS